MANLAPSSHLVHERADLMKLLPAPQRQWVALAVVLGLLVAWDRVLVRHEARERQAGVRIAKLLSPGVFRQRPVVAVRVERPSGETFLYVHRQGVWRCLSSHGAIALTPRLEGLFRKLFEAQGVVQTRFGTDASPLRAFGLAADQRLRISFCGAGVRTLPSGDVIYALDVGAPIPSGTGCYVHPAESGEIWAVDADFREGLTEESGHHGAPWLDPSIVPLLWPGTAAGLRRIRLEPRGESPLELLRRDHSPTEAEQQRGRPPWDWLLRRNAAEQKADARQASLYALFLLHAPYDEVLPPGRRTDYALDSPAVRLVLEADAGEPIELLIAKAASGPGTVVWNSFSQCLYAISPAVADALAPTETMLLDPKSGAPWERWLQ